MKLPKKNTRAKFRAAPAANARSPNSGRSSSGSPPRRVSRRSQARVSAKTGTQAARQAQVQAGQPWSWPRVSGASASATDAETPAAPSGSSRGLRCPRACGTTSAAAISAAAPTGTFTRKIARQPRPNTSACSSRPPRIWPDTKASPIVTPNQASARLRSRGRERRGDQREDLRHHDRAGQALQQPGADEFGGGPGQPAQQRGGREAGHAGHEHPPVPRQVTQPPAGHHAAGVHERVPAHDQLQRRVAHVQVALQRRPGHVHHPDIEARHEHRQQHHRQHQPATRARRRCGIRHDTPLAVRWFLMATSAGPGIRPATADKIGQHGRIQPCRSCP